MRKSLLMLLFIQQLAFCYAQQAETTRFGEIDLKRVSEFFYTDNNDIITAVREETRSGRLLQIKKYDSHLQLQYVKDLQALSLSQDCDLYWTGKKYLIANYKSSQVAKKSTIYQCSILTTEDNQSSGFNKVHSIPLQLENEKSTFFIESPDKSKFLHVIEAKAESIKQSGQKHIYLTVLDSEGNVLWETVFTENSLSEYFDDLYSITINNNGEVALILKRYMPENTGKYNSPQINGEYIFAFDFEILLFNNQGIVQKTNIDLNGKKIINIAVQSNPVSSTFFFTGMSGTQKAMTMRGFFFTDMDMNNNILRSTEEDFTPEFIDSFSNGIRLPGRRGNQISLLNNFAIADILTRKDGGLYIVFEFRRIYRSTNTSYSKNGPTVYTTSYTWNNRDLIITSLDARGQVDWHFRLPKRHYAFNDDLNRNISSTSWNSVRTTTTVLPIVFENDLALLYTDNHSNRNKSIYDKLHPVGYSIKDLELIRILDPQKNLKTIELFPKEKKDFRLSTSARVKEGMILHMSYPVRLMQNMDEFYLLKLVP